jgi:hypothetical protein
VALVMCEAVGQTKNTPRTGHKELFDCQAHKAVQYAGQCVCDGWTGGRVCVGGGTGGLMQMQNRPRQQNLPTSNW